MRKLLFSLLAAGSIMSCSKKDMIEDPVTIVPDPPVIEDPVSVDDPVDVGINSLSFNFAGPDKWFGPDVDLTGKGTPSEDYSDGAYNVYLYKNSRSSSNLVEAKQVASIDDNVTFETGIISNTTYFVDVAHAIESGLNRRQLMWEDTFPLTGTTSFTYDSGSVTETLTISPKDISQLSTDVNEAYKVTFRQWYYQFGWEKDGELSGNNKLVNTISFTEKNADTDDVSVYFNVKGAPTYVSSSAISGQSYAYSFPIAYGYSNAVIEIEVQPLENSTDTYKFFLGDTTGTQGVPTGMTASNTLLSSLDAHTNYSLDITVTEDIANSPPDAVSVDVVVDNKIVGSLSQSIPSYTDDDSDDADSNLGDAEIDVDSFNDINFPSGDDGTRAQRILHPTLWDGIKGGVCDGTDATTVSGDDDDWDVVYYDDTEQIKYVNGNHTLTYDADDLTLTYNSYTAITSPTIVGEETITFTSTQGSETLEFIFFMNDDDFDGADYSHDCSN